MICHCRLLVLIGVFAVCCGWTLPVAAAPPLSPEETDEMKRLLTSSDLSLEQLVRRKDLLGRYLEQQGQPQSADQSRRILGEEATQWADDRGVSISSVETQLNEIIRRGDAEERIGAVTSSVEPRGSAIQQVDFSTIRPVAEIGQLPWLYHPLVSIQAVDGVSSMSTLVSDPICIP